MKRRQFLAVGASLLTVPFAPTPSAVAQGGASGRAVPVGSFLVDIGATSVRVTHQAEPERVLWETLPNRNFLAAAQGRADIREFGTPEGSFDIQDRIATLYDRQSVEAIETQEGALTVAGRLAGDRGEVGYRFALTAVSQNQLRFNVSLQGPNASEVNRLFLRYASSPDEAFFGFGQQLTYFDQKGNLLPILVQEHGVGRGRPVVTQLVDLFGAGGGRNPYVTEAPAPHYVSSRLRSLFLENTEYSNFDLRHADRVEVKVFSGEMAGRILYGRTPLDLVEEYTAYAGRMRALPDWIHEGAIVAVQGGTDVAMRKLQDLTRADVPLAGFWIQDWTGARVTAAGKQLWWNWRLDESFYPRWDELVDALARQDAHMLIYINPFLTNEAGHSELFEEGEHQGYLVRKEDGSAYLIRNTDFSAGLLDLSNPGTRAWIKGIIKDELIGRARVAGWMADFGEALPFDARLAGGADPGVWHNRYPVEWARVNREAIEEAGRGEDIVFFNRSGFTQSPGAATLFWLGDQLQSWDEYDGIKTAVVGLLSGGISGFSLLHSDVGGYVTLSLDVAGRTVPVFARTKELLMRWMELNAFTSVFRTHEGLDPSISAQIDTDAETMAHLARCAKIYKALGSYRRRLVEEAAEKGYPVVRHPFLHYPDDPNVLGLRYQFMLGPDFMVAPVLDHGAESVQVYLPVGGGGWTDLWTGADAGGAGEWFEAAAPLGKPAVFSRKGAQAGAELIERLRSLGVY